MVREPFESLEIIIQLGFDRVLTSGSDCSALEGLPLLRELVEKVSVEKGADKRKNYER